MDFLNSCLLLYPISDAIMIIPALIGIALFFKGEVNFMWTLVCLGILSVFIADTVFFLAQFDDTYYTGSPTEILFLWTCIFLSESTTNFPYSKNESQITTNQTLWNNKMKKNTIVLFTSECRLLY